MYVISAIIVATVIGAFTFWIVKEGSKPKDKQRLNRHAHSH